MLDDEINDISEKLKLNLTTLELRGKVLEIPMTLKRKEN